MFSFHDATPIELNFVSSFLTSSLSDDVVRIQPDGTSFPMVTLPLFALRSAGQFGSSLAGCSTQPPVMHTGPVVKPALECTPN
jgi:hypothetical protein